MKKLLLCFWISTIGLIQINMAQDCDLNELIRKYAPQLRLHSDESYNPASVEWYLPRAKLRYNQQDIKGVNELSIVNFHDEAHNGNSVLTSTNFDVPIAGNQFTSLLTRAGSLENARVYVHVGHAPLNPENRYLQYWIFYPYNGPSILGTGKHEGDWERITVRLNGQCGSISKIHYATHGDQGKWYLPGEFKFTNGTHPIVYSANNGHGFYPTSGKQARGGGTPDDHTNNSGLRFNSWENYKVVKIDSKVQDDTKWIDFAGRWGNSDGVTGPNGQRPWRDFDENITFFEKNGGFGDRIIAIADYENRDINLHGSIFSPGDLIPAQWTNDRIRSARIFSAREGTRFRVYDSPSQSQIDDYTSVFILRNIDSFVGVVIPTFEKTYSTDDFSVTYHSHNGLDGKISNIEITPSPISAPTLIVGAGAACYASKSTYKLLFGNRKPRTDPQNASWSVSPASWFKQSSGGGFSTTLEVTNPTAQGEATITFNYGSNSNSTRTFTRKIWVGKPKKPGIIAGPSSFASNSSVTYSIPNIVSPNDGYYHWEAPCNYDLFTQTKTCWDDLGGIGTLNSFLSSNFSGSIQVTRVNECGESVASHKTVMISGSNDSPDIPRFGPNPADEILTIRANAANLELSTNDKLNPGTYDVKLYNSNSKLIYSGRMTENDATEIKTSHLKEGIYFLVMSKGNQMIQKQIIINHE